MRRLLVGVLLAVPLLAHAAYYWMREDGVQTQYSSAGAACEAWASAADASDASYFPTINYVWSSTGHSMTAVSATKVQCTRSWVVGPTGGGTSSGSGSIYVDRGGTADPPPACTKGKTDGGGYYDIGTDPQKSPPVAVCTGGCLMIFEGNSPAGSAYQNDVKHWYAKGDYFQTGDSCTPQSGGGATPDGQPPTSNVPPDTCKYGPPGTVNGKTVCPPNPNQNTTQPPSPPASSSQSTDTKTTTNPDGSQTSTETTTKKNGDGSTDTTTTTKVVRPDGSTTTTTTSQHTNPDGSTPTQADQQKQGECQANPAKSGCGGQGANITGLYTKKDRTLSDVLSANRDKFAASPAGSAVLHFFNVGSGGTCPTWTLSLDYLRRSYTLDQFCSSFATSALGILKACLLVVGAFFAFRIAVE